MWSRGSRSRHNRPTKPQKRSLGAWLARLMHQIYAQGFWPPTSYVPFWMFLWRLKNDGHIHPLSADPWSDHCRDPNFEVS